MYSTKMEYQPSPHYRTLIILIFSQIFSTGFAKIDEFNLENDQRSLIPLVNFGMFQGGILSLTLNLQIDVTNTYNYSKAFGLTIDRTTQSSAQATQYSESQYETDHVVCVLQSSLLKLSRKTIMVEFELSPNGNAVAKISKMEDMKDVTITAGRYSLSSDKPDTHSETNQILNFKNKNSTSDLSGSTDNKDSKKNGKVDTDSKSHTRRRRASVDTKNTLKQSGDNSNGKTQKLTAKMGLDADQPTNDKKADKQVGSKNSKANDKDSHSVNEEEPTPSNDKNSESIDGKLNNKTSSKTEKTSSKPDETSLKLDETSSKPDETSLKLDETSSKPDETSNSDSGKAPPTNVLVIAANEINGTLPMNMSIETRKGSKMLLIEFDIAVYVTSRVSEGYYSVYFHNCAPLKTSKHERVPIQLQAYINGSNLNPKFTYLSAGDIPEPYLFFGISIAYVLLSLVWLRVLRTASSGVFKTHYLMLAVCYCKALSALFHGTNYYYIGQKGKEETAWAVIYYISYLMKTVILFLTIMLIGSGWAFIKHVFSDKEKKLFLVAIPLQVLVYIAYVIFNETEVASKTYATWHTIAVVVDLMCCAAILLPVVWSISHLQEGSKIDGKAAFNLQKLKLFRSLYIMIIAYIYITRIVVFVFKMAFPFQLAWLGDCFTEVTVIMFLIMLGYKFRPADDNPYFQVPPDSDDEDENVEMVVTKTGVNSDTKRRVVHVNTEDVERQGLLSRTNNESSHEFD